MDEQTAELIIQNQEKYGLPSGVITKINFLKNKEQIEKLSSDGLSIKVIWTVMKEKENFKISYPHFVKLFRTNIKPNHNLNTSKTDYVEPNSSQNSSSLKQRRQNTFDFNATPNKNDLV